MLEPALTIPFFDPGPMHDGLREQLLADIGRLIDSGAFTNGYQVEAFESEFARFAGTRYCVGVASGLDALRLGLVAAGFEPGDEVVVPSATFAATFEAVTQAGGVPVVVDVLDDDYGLDPEAAEDALTERTRFLMPVHLYGQLADMRRLKSVATGRGVAIIEDSCQAHGATRDGIRAGQGGLAGAFSFYPAKNLGAMGDAGALVTDDEQLADEVRCLREHGQREKYRHAREGYTSRLDTIQAIVLLHKLPQLERWNEERRALAGLYGDALAGVGDLRLPPVAHGSVPAWHLYVVRTHDPAALAGFLRARGIATGRHYPEPPHLSAAYAGLGHARGAFPVGEALSRQALSLPLYPGMSDSHVERVSSAIASFFAGP
jgi:dTDP-3-amino-3,4,6-trideoxy-alpha-D-glucose transaminase